MKRVLTLSVLVVGLLIVAAPLVAHHGRGATYDGSKEVTLKGTVTELAWRNPHVVIYMDVKDEAGKVTNWGFESSNVSSMSRDGWSRNSLRPGQEVTVTFNPSRAGAPIGVVRKVLLADGSEIRSRGSANTID
jgi:hypothetical protein